MSNTEDDAKKDAPAPTKKPTANNPAFNTALGIAALIVIAFFANWLVSLSAVGNITLDLTEEKVHTLTPGTKAILADLKKSEAEVVIKYYATRDAEFMPQQVKLYMKKVDGVLKRYQSLAGGNLRIVNLNPEPDTDAEDSARLDGIAGQSLNGENLYLGISVSFLDEKATIPFLAPSAETQLEYQLSSAIARVARTDKPTLGLMSVFPMAGSSPAAPGLGQAPSQPFIVYEQLQQLYELKDITMTPTPADLDGLAAVLVVHPAGITPETEYLLDQYLLQGGTIVAALDSFSLTAQQVGGGNPLTGQTGIPMASTFSKDLLDSWGVSFVSSQVIADGNYRTKFQGGDSTSALSLTKDAFPQKDNIITESLGNLFFVLAGAFSSDGKEGLSHTSLIRTTTDAGFVDGRRAIQLDPSLLGSIQATDKAYDLAMHVQGNFKTAFPDGNPAQKKEEETDTETATTQAEEAEKEEVEEQPSLTESTKTGNVFLISDTDFIGDRFAYQQLFGGLIAPQGDNAAFLLNILDQVTGSKHLIGSRSRTDSRRPFTVIQKMESEFEEKSGSEREEKQKELDDINTRLSELIQTQQQNGQVVLEGELKDEYDKGLAKQVEARKSLRKLEKELRSNKDALAVRYTATNFLAVPLVVVLIGFCVFLKRRFSTSAR